MIVADASPLIALSRIGQLTLCRQLFEVVAIPRAVESEILAHPHAFGAARPAWIVTHEVPVTPRLTGLLARLDSGEAEAICLADELEAPLLIDELEGRRVAQTAGVSLTGTLGVLLAAKRAGHIRRVEQLLWRLQSEHFHMSTRLMSEVLRAAGEEPTT